MTEEGRLYRVLSMDETEETVTLDPIREVDEGFIDGDEPSQTVSMQDTDEGIQRIFSLLSPGHIVQASLTQDSPADVTKIEHRGGAEFRAVDERSVPYIVRALADDHNEIPTKFGSLPEEPTDVSFQLKKEVVDPLEKSKLFGELYVQVPSDDGEQSWERFRSGTGSESVYGSFASIEGVPTEILIGNPQHRSYWYALMFVEERTPIAQKILAQFGILYDDRFVPDPTISHQQALNKDGLPANPDEHPRELLNESYEDIPDSWIPERSGQATIDIFSEFLLMSREIDFFGDTSRPDPEEVTTGIYESFSTTTFVLFDFHLQLVDKVYEQKSLEETPPEEVNSEDLPSIELFAQSYYRTLHRLHRVETFLDRVDQIDLEEYTHDFYSKSSELRETYNKQGIEDSVPERMRTILAEMRDIVNEFKQVLAMSDQVAKPIDTEDGIEYDLRLNEDAHEYFTTFMTDFQRESMGITPDGKRDPSIMRLGLLHEIGGQLTTRYEWLSVSGAGFVGEVSKAMYPQLAQRSNW